MHERLDLREGIEPRNERFALLPLPDAEVQALADGAGQPGYFSISYEIHRSDLAGFSRMKWMRSLTAVVLKELMHMPPIRSRDDNKIFRAVYSE